MDVGQRCRTGTVSAQTVVVETVTDVVLVMLQRFEQTSCSLCTAYRLKGKVCVGVSQMPGYCEDLQS